MRFDIKCEVFLGSSHCGDIVTTGKGKLELTEAEVSILVNLIKGYKTTDIDSLDIERSYPDLYKKMHSAYYELEHDTAELYWLWEGYNNNVYEYDYDQLKEYCREELGFSFEHNENDDIDSDDYEVAENEAFDEWLDSYLAGLDDDEVRDFFYDHMNADLILEEMPCEIEIPAAIIEMAQKDHDHLPS